MMPARIRDFAATSAPAERPWISRDLVSVQDFSPEEIMALYELARALKDRPVSFREALVGKQLVLFFEKASLRTRLTFEAGMASMGGTSVFVDQTHARLEEREPLLDVARNVERWGDLKNVHLAYVGDGNNMAHSLMLTAASLGSKITVACPAGYAPDPTITSTALQIAKRTGAQIGVMEDPVAAVKGADAVYTDVWASMGQEDEADERAKIFAPYQVNAKLFARASREAIFMHCLPAHRGLEVTADIIDSPQSIIYDQAENRMHVQKAILLSLLGGIARRPTSRSHHA